MVERQRLLVVVPAASVGGSGEAPLVVATQVTRHTGPGGARMGFQCLVIEPRELPLVIAEVDIPAPRHGWELRTSGLWADHVCEEPGRRWSYGLEAFALAIDDGRELLERGYGQPVPLGWELDFEASDGAGDDSPGPQPGRVTGRLQWVGREVEIDGPALRGHTTSDDPAGPDATARHLGEHLALGAGPAGPPPDRAGVGGEPLIDVALPGPDGVWWVARTPTGLRCRGL